MLKQPANKMTWNNHWVPHCWHIDGYRWCRLRKHEFRLSKEDCGDANEEGCLDFEANTCCFQTCVLSRSFQSPRKIMSHHFPSLFTFFRDEITHEISEDQCQDPLEHLQGAIRVHQERRWTPMRSTGFRYPLGESRVWYQYQEAEFHHHHHHRQDQLPIIPPDILYLYTFIYLKPFLSTQGCVDLHECQELAQLRLPHGCRLECGPHRFFFRSVAVETGGFPQCFHLRRKMVKSSMFLGGSHFVLTFWMDIFGPWRVDKCWQRDPDKSCCNDFSDNAMSGQKWWEL